MKYVMTAVAFALASACPFVSSATTHTPNETQAAQRSPLTEGEVRKVDKDAKKLTIRHGPIVNLDMPPMTMVFQVQDAAVLEQVKVGDRIRFKADKVGGVYTVTGVEAAK